MAAPEVLLLDEPDGNIDSKTSEELEKLIISLKREGISIILCSHHKGFAYRTSDVIIDMYQGSPVSHDENIFKGEYIYLDGLYSEFRTGEHRFRCPSREGDYSAGLSAGENKKAPGSWRKQ
jgi:ABC-type multidrug transport system ATPase subunit